MLMYTHLITSSSEIYGRKVHRKKKENQTNQISMDMRWEYSKGGAFDSKAVCFLVLGLVLGALYMPS